MSRQAVSLWFKQGDEVTLKGSHLVAVAKALALSVEQLTSELPGRV